MRIDLHVHSKASKRPSSWFLQKLGCPESFSEPLQIYRVAKARGMSLVTLTDHNTIDGALEIAHLPDTFISEEVTSYFPEDRCKVHVLTLNITEKQHRDIQHLRENIYELVEMLRLEKIFHIVAHPLYDINDRLTADHFEKMLLLFQHFELNGARNDRENQCLKTILQTLTRDRIERLASKHNIQPTYRKPWEKILFGGSDDHSGLNIARTYTEIKGVRRLPANAFADVGRDAVNVVSRPSTPLTMAHNIYGIAYQFYRNKFNLERHAGKDILIQFLENSLRIDAEKDAGLVSKLYMYWAHRRQRHARPDISGSFMDLLRAESRKLIQDNPDLIPSMERPDAMGREPERKWFDFVNQASNRVMLHFADHLFDHLAGANVFNIFHTIGSAGGLYTLLAPYFIAFSLFSKDRHLSETICRQLGDERLALAFQEDGPGVAHFTDTHADVNGVALTLRQQVATALKHRKRLTLITCGSFREPPDPAEGLKNFLPVGEYDLPEYPGQKIHYPPLLEMLAYCYENRFTHIHSATPGPVGLAALAIARILKLPISGTYHTSVPQYAQFLTGDPFVEEITWKYMLWYYDQMDVIYVPSESTGAELIDKGIKARKIKCYPRGIDIDRFHPSKRSPLLRKRYGIDQKLTFVYVGRVSKEKNLHVLCESFRALAATRSGIHLMVVGDGPFLKEMKKRMQNLPATFTGFVQGEELTRLYAACDAFVFPSATDTFGNVVLEAQASGLPVIVTDAGGPRENVIDGTTGLVTRGGDAESLLEAMAYFIDHPQQVETMGKQAREYMENRSFEGAFIKAWAMYTSPSQDDALSLDKAG